MTLDEIINQVSPFLVGAGVGAVGTSLLFTSGILGYRSLKRTVSRMIYGEDLDKKRKIRKSKERLIAVIPIEGLLTSTPSKSDLPFSNGKYAIPKEIIANIDSALADRRVRGIVFDINCPGGYVQPSEELSKYMFSKVRRETKESVKRRYNHPNLKKEYEPNLPTVALVRMGGASGGYLAASACNYIVAYETSTVGSIGVFIMRPDFSETLSLLGTKIYITKAGEKKAQGLPFTPFDDKEKESLQTEVNKIHDWFIKSVHDYRGHVLSLENIRNLATGEGFIGLDAIKNGLIDEIGGMEEAIQAIEKLGKFHHTDLLEYKRRNTHSLLQLPKIQKQSLVQEIISYIFNPYNTPRL